MKKRVTIDDLYPTQSARQKADDYTDTLDFSISVQQLIAEWERVYFQSGGKPGKRVKI